MIEPERTKQRMTVAAAASIITNIQPNIGQLVEVAETDTNLISPFTVSRKASSLVSLSNGSSCATRSKYIAHYQMRGSCEKSYDTSSLCGRPAVDEQLAFGPSNSHDGTSDGDGSKADSNVVAGQHFEQTKLEANKKRSTALKKAMQMRSSQIESVVLPVAQQRANQKRIPCCSNAKKDGSTRLSNAIAGVEVCLSKDLKCHPFKSSIGLVKGASKVVPATKGHRELEVEWTAKVSSLFKRVARLGAGSSSRSLFVRTGLVEPESIKVRKKEIQKDSFIENAFKSLVQDFRNPNLEDVSRGERESDSSQSSSRCCGNEISCNVESETARLRNCSDYHDNNIRTSFSCHSQLNTKQVVTETRTNQELANRSSNISSNVKQQSYSSINMSTSVDLMKNKCLVEDKVRKQQQRKISTSKYSDPIFENRRSTYCSSMGATDINYDSSYSSVINCSESNNTSAMNRISSKDSTTDKRIKDIEDSKRLSGDGTNESEQVAVIDLKKRENWKNIEFLLAVIGFAVDLGNVWRFPYICYKNGGGAFLIPYTIMFILGGLPIFYLEMSLGQYFSSGCLTVWRKVCPLAKGIGYAMCLLNFYTGLYYNTIISWAVFFFVESFTSILPWTSCNNPWNSPDCRTIDQRQALKLNVSLASQPTTSQVYYSSPTKDYFEREVLRLHLSTGIDDLGDVRKPLAIYLAIVFVFIYFAIWKGVKSTGKAVWVTALLPYFVLIPLLIRGVFLEGAWLGIKYYLYPEWGKIIAVDVWVEAAKQIYFSLGPGFGTLMALSSYNKFNHNCRKDALIAASVNYFASFISGLVIFAVLGYMATIENVSVEDVATEGPGLVFQVYPEGLATMQFSSVWSVLFFIMVITLGIDSTFGGLESVITGLCDEYPRTLRANRGIFIGILIVLIYLCSLPTTTFGGNYVIYVVESYGTSLSLLFIVLVETVIVCWLYGTDRFCKNLEEMYGETPGPYWRICWKYISPTILLLIFIAACGQELDKYHVLSNGNYTYPGWAPTVGLLMTGSSVCCIPIYAIYHLKAKTQGRSFYERLKIAIRPIDSNQKVENEMYVDASIDKIKEENRFDY